MSTIHCSCVSVAFSTLTSVGRAMLRIVMSSETMSIDTQSTPRAAQRRAWYAGANSAAAVCESTA